MSAFSDCRKAGGAMGLLSEIKVCNSNGDDTESNYYSCGC